MQELWNDIRAAGWMQRFVWANVALFLVAALTLDDAATAALFFLFVAGVILLIRDGRSRELSRPELFLLAGFAGYFLVGVLAYNLGIKTRLGWEILFRDIRFLFAIPAWIAVRRFPPPVRLIWSALLLGAFSMLTVAVVNYLSPAEGWRAHGATLSIVFGHLGVGMALACAAGAVFLTKKGWRWALLAGALAATVAVVLSGTRGAWLSLTGAGGLLGLFWWWRTGWRQRFASGAIALVLVIVASVLLYRPLVSRVEQAFTEWNEYQTVERMLVQHEAVFQDSACIDESALLEQLSRHLVKSGEGKLSVSIVQITDFAEQTNCSGTHALHITNLSARLSAWVYFPPRSVTDKMAGTARFWVRGEGALQQAGDPESLRRFDVEKWTALSIKGEPIFPPRVIALLKARQAMYLVPVVVQAGEYRYFHTFTSAGARLAMWQTAWDIFRAAPWLGAGTGGFPTAAAEQVRLGLSSGVALQFDHPHNDYLAVLADRGLLGLLFLLLLYGAPLRLFAAALRCGAGPGARAAATSGLLLVAGFMLSGVTETLFNHSLVITYYCLFVAILGAAARGHSRGRITP